MRLSTATLILALGLVVLCAPARALAQGGSAQDRIAAAASALEGVNSLRFTGQTNVTPQATGDSIKVFAGSGEYQAPDRGHMTVEQPTLQQVTETITVGQVAWLRTVDGTGWVPVSSLASPPAARTIADELRQVSRYLVGPTVTDGDSQAVVTADVDVAQAVTDESPVAALIGVGFTGDTDQSSLINGSRVTITIDKASGLPVGMDTWLSMTPGVPPEGIPAGPVTITTTLSLMDFNNPELVVRAPGE